MLPVSLLSSFVDIVADEEDQFWAEYNPDDYRWGDEEDKTEFTRGVILGWVEAHPFPTSATCDEAELAAFIALLENLSSDLKSELCASAMTWVAAAAEAGDLESVKSIANALK